MGISIERRAAQSSEPWPSGWVGFGTVRSEDGVVRIEFTMPAGRGQSEMQVNVSRDMFEELAGAMMATSAQAACHAFGVALAKKFTVGS